MRNLLLAAAGALALTAVSAAPSSAMPIGNPSAPDEVFTQVRDGCGPGMFRTPYGQCRPMRGPGYRPPPPPPGPPGWGPPPGGPGWGPPPGGPGWGPPPGPRPQRCWWADGPYGPRRVCR